MSSSTEGKLRRARRQSGHAHVTWHKTRRKWIGRFMVNGKMQHVGYWKESELAKAVFVTNAVREQMTNEPAVGEVSA